MASKKKSKFSLPGFRFAGVSAGIKGKGKPDLALIVSDRPAKAVAFFTVNRLKAAPIIQGQRAIRGGSLRAVVVNAGNANAATGKQGIRDAFATAQAAAKLLKISPNEVLVSSTGKIGVPLDMKKIRRGLPAAAKALSSDGLAQAARAILTTDAFPKTHAVTGKIQGKSFRVVGVAKGAGMIEPHMATMLAYILTDLDLERGAMRWAFRRAVEASFHSITVDGDTSTNDTALLLANGASGISALRESSAGFAAFRRALDEVCRTLALKMVQDGEGATKEVEIFVRGAKTERAAKRVAYAIARSQLVKTSFFGEDPNWGRVFAAAGYSGETFDPSRVDIYYGSVPLVRGGSPTGAAREAQAHREMRKSRFRVTVDLKAGRGQAQVWTSDLTYGYVKINAEYRT
jgi:glutamate N-acetyltransferase/amino-acid N-acetyltransferase